MRTGVMICGHGSRDPDAAAEFARAAARLEARLPERDVAYGYLEFARPTIRAGLEKLAGRGAQIILVLPGMLFAARHVRTDLPREIARFAADFPHITTRFGRALSIDPMLVKAAAERIEEGERRGRREISRRESLLLVIGRGTNDREANATVGELASMLCEKMGFGRAEIGYSGTAPPTSEAALRQAAQLGFRRIVVFPYFLFTGVLVKRIDAACARVAADHPEIEILQAPYLSDHPLVIDCFVARVTEMIDGVAAPTA